MKSDNMTKLLDDLIAQWESEIVEFKQANDNFSTDEIGRYFSALANEANLADREQAWLVFGVHNKTRAVVGTSYRLEPERLHSLKNQILVGTNPGVTFTEINEVGYSGMRVLLFAVPAAPRGMPIAWNGHWYGRAGESLTALSVTELDTIRVQAAVTDWTAHVVDEARLHHLDENAIRLARESFAKKHSNRIDPAEVMAWSPETFLDRAFITRDGRVTRAALLLLGKPESTHLLSPHPAHMVWNLVGAERAYEHFGPPFLLNTTAIYQRIRNIQIRLLPQDELWPVEVAKYDQKSILEALHNCIAHQDYTRNGRIVVTEHVDRLVFENEGDFFEGKPESYVTGGKVPHRYRNPFLVQAMTELNMIDRMGYGIHDIFRKQAQRYLPMPDYDLRDGHSVILTVYGAVVDRAYTILLMENTSIPLEDILALDRVQKRLPLANDAIAHLRKAGLIEGRKPYFHISASVAAAVGKKAEYIRTRGLDDAHFMRLITEYLEKFGTASRAELNDFLLDKLSDGLNGAQKINKIGNLLTKMRNSGIIHNIAAKRNAKWVVTKTNGDNVKKV